MKFFDATFVVIYRMTGMPLSKTTLIMWMNKVVTKNRKVFDELK